VELERALGIRRALFVCSSAGDRRCISFGELMANSRDSSDGPAQRGGDAAGSIVLVDGSNVAHSSEGDQPLLSNITAVCDKLRDEGYEPLVLVDAALRHQIDDRAAYERLVDSGAIRQAPAGTDADYFILSFARELDASIVSNDRYRDRQRSFPDASKRLIRYMVMKGEVVLERRTGPRHE
jgi:hypothetical protein